MGGGLLDLDDLMAEADRARRIPAFEPSWRNLRLNQRCDPEVEGRLVSRAVWEANGGAVDEAALAGRPCFGGLDLSGKHDLTSLTLVFPGGDPEAPTYDILQRFWTPLGAMAQRPVREQDLFRQWIAAGFITGLDGPVIRYRQMARELARLQDSYAIKAVAYDAWRIEAFELDMEEAGVTGLPLVKFGQGWRSMAPGGRVLRGMRARRPAAARQPPGADRLHRQRGHRQRSGGQPEGGQGAVAPAGHDADRRRDHHHHGARRSADLHAAAGDRRAGDDRVIERKAEEETPPLPTEAVSRPGDLWHRGPHRVLCDDATGPSAVGQLVARMGGTELRNER